jgi:nucleoside 2-deoxyribosyltransferase
MWIDKATDDAYFNGIKKAIEATGYEAVRIDLKEHNQKICDLIMSEIRHTGFLVADFTGHRHGVYFEAGFALGLGLPVIWTCRKQDIENAHFDTRQYNHILWETADELCTKLKNRVLATIPMAK